MKRSKKQQSQILPYDDYLLTGTPTSRINPPLHKPKLHNHSQRKSTRESSSSFKQRRELSRQKAGVFKQQFNQHSLVKQLPMSLLMPPKESSMKRQKSGKKQNRNLKSKLLKNKSSNELIDTKEKTGLKISARNTQKWPVSFDEILQRCQEVMDHYAEKYQDLYFANQLLLRENQALRGERASCPI